MNFDARKYVIITFVVLSLAKWMLVRAEAKKGLKT
jgi:hypothetical protein